MEIPLTVEQEAQLSRLAVIEGKRADELAREVFLSGLQVYANLVASRCSITGGQQAAARMLKLRQGNMLPDEVTIKDIVREGRA